ncbi:MAG: hypothetical protein SF162_15505 [bacterium]|nr:hypothetical protein [bacterium]
MYNSLGLIFFALFALTLFGMYILVRRRIGSAVVVSALGVALSMVSFMLFTITQGNTLVWAILMGLVIGGLFSGTALLVARYFIISEERRARFDPYAPAPTDAASGDAAAGRQSPGTPG